MDSYRLPSDFRAELILKEEYPKVKEKAKADGVLGETIKAYFEATSSVEIKWRSRGCFDGTGDLLRCFVGLNAARKVVGWDKIEFLEDLVVKKDPI